MPSSVFRCMSTTVTHSTADWWDVLLPPGIDTRWQIQALDIGLVGPVALA